VAATAPDLQSFNFAGLALSFAGQSTLPPQYPLAVKTIISYSEKTFKIYDTTTALRKQSPFF